MNIFIVLLWTGSAYIFFAELLYSIVYSARLVSMGLNQWYILMNYMYALFISGFFLIHSKYFIFIQRFRILERWKMADWLYCVIFMVFIYRMVTPNVLRMHEGKFRFVTDLNLIKCLDKKLGIAPNVRTYFRVTIWYKYHSYLSVRMKMGAIRNRNGTQVRLSMDPVYEYRFCERQTVSFFHFVFPSIIKVWPLIRDRKILK